MFSFNHKAINGMIETFYRSSEPNSLFSNQPIAIISYSIPFNATAEKLSRIVNEAPAKQ